MPELSEVVPSVDPSPAISWLTGTCSADAICVRRLAPTRFTPFSYFCTCWNVTPNWSASADCDMPLASRWILIRWPTATSMASGFFFLPVIIGSALSIDHPRQILGLFDQPAPRHGIGDPAEGLDQPQTLVNQRLAAAR